MLTKTLLMLSNTKQAPEAGGCATGDGVHREDRGDRGHRGHRDTRDLGDTGDTGLNSGATILRHPTSALRSSQKWVRSVLTSKSFEKF